MQPVIAGVSAVSDSSVTRGDRSIAMMVHSPSRADSECDEHVDFNPPADATMRPGGCVVLFGHSTNPRELEASAGRTDRMVNR